MREYSVVIPLDFENLPSESEVIERLIQNGTLGKFLYAVVNDIIEGNYNLDASHNKIILDQLISTVSSIFETVLSMDTNITDITGSLNQHTTMLEALKGLKLITPKDDVEIESTTIEEELAKSPVYATSSPPAVELEVDVEATAEDLVITEDFEAMFDLDMNS